MNDFIRNSLLASIVLTVILNVLPRLFPGATEKLSRKASKQFDQMQPSEGAKVQSGVKVFFPWKIMLAVSIIGTILLNLL